MVILMMKMVMIKKHYIHFLTQNKTFTYKQVCTKIWSTQRFLHTTLSQHPLLSRAQNIFDTQIFTNKNLYTQKLLNTSFQTIPTLHIGLFTHRRLLHTQILDAGAFTLKIFYAPENSLFKTDGPAILPPGLSHVCGSHSIFTSGITPIRTNIADADM